MESENIPLGVDISNQIYSEGPLTVGLPSARPKEVFSVTMSPKINDSISRGVPISYVKILSLTNLANNGHFVANCY